MGVEQLKVEDRILLHLQNYIRFADEYEVPKAMSQKGIGEAVWIAWSNVPRAMKSLREQDLVDERTTRVKGEFRKKKVYVLTPQGFARAQELREDLGRRTITVRRAGEERQMVFADVPEFVGFKVPYLELLRGIEEDGLLDVERAQTRWREQVEMVDHTDRAPKLHAFHGREEELENLASMAEERRFVVIHGIAGIGKTTMAVRILEDLRQQTNVLWVTLHGWDTLAGVLRQMADFLSDAGRKQLSSLLEDRPEPELGEAYYSLEEDLKDLKGVLFFDDFHKATPPLVDMMSMLLEILKDRPSPTMVLITRYQPSFYDRRYVVVNQVVGELLLEGLDRAAARAMLEGRGLSDQEFDRVYATTQGHPLALELVMSRDAGVGRPFKDVMAFVREEVFEGLTDDERRILSAVSVHRANVPREAALAIAGAEGGGQEVLDDLFERGLVVDVGDSELHLHDLVREFFLSRLGEEERRERHREAAEAWGRVGTPEALVERAYHLVGAGEAEAAVAVLASEPSRALTNVGTLRDVMAILDDATSSGDLSPAAADEADLLRGDALTQMDQVDPALAIFTRVMDRAVAEGDRGQEARVLYRIGLIHTRRGQSSNALEVQRRAITAFEEVDDEAGAGLCRLAIAEVLMDGEDNDQAVEELGHAHESFSVVEDRHGVARTCVKLASIMLDKEDPQVALNYLEEALDNLDRPEGGSTLSWVQYYMGEVARMEERWEEATEHYEQAVDLFQRTGNEHMAANACTYLGDAYQALGDSERAEVFYQRGLDMMVAQ
jgi:ATP/maltotriose-dependent transcriptional regulator MalT/DNA-binding PadR family transcriptional regulator